MSRDTVADRMRRHDVAVRPRPEGLSRQRLVDLYVEEALTIDQVAARLGCSVGTARSGLRRYGIPLRPRPRPRTKPLERDQIIERYVDRGLSLVETAAELGCSPSTVREAMLDHHIPRRRRGGWDTDTLDPGALRRAYLEEGPEPSRGRRAPRVLVGAGAQGSHGRRHPPSGAPTSSPGPGGRA
ncbi:MAG: hypothetical protein ACRD0L_15810 [Acidimicrobiales bacterium]